MKGNYKAFEGTMKRIRRDIVKRMTNIRKDIGKYSKKYWEKSERTLKRSQRNNKVPLEEKIITDDIRRTVGGMRMELRI